MMAIDSREEDGQSARHLELEQERSMPIDAMKRRIKSVALETYAQSMTSPIHGMDGGLL